MKLEETLGISKAALFHFWVLAVILDTVAKNIWFETNLIVEGQNAPWLTIGPLASLTVGAVALFYLTELFVEEEDHFFKHYVYVSLNAMIFFCSVGVCVDVGLYLMDKESFCSY